MGFFASSNTILLVANGGDLTVQSGYTLEIPEGSKLKYAYRIYKGGKMTIEEGASFTTDNTDYSLTSTGEQGRIDGTLIVNGTMTNTNNLAGAYGFDLHGSADVTIGKNGSVTTNSNVRLLQGDSGDTGTPKLTVNGELKTTGERSFFYANAVVTVSGTYTADQQSLWKTDNTERIFRIGNGASSTASFTVKTGGLLEVFTNAKYVFDCNEGSSFTLEQGATAIFDGSFRNKFDPGLNGECWINGGGTIKIDGSMTVKGPHATASQTFDIKGGSATIGATGSVDSSSYTRAREGAILTVDGALKSGAVFEMNASTVVINGKLTVADSGHIFHTGGSGTTTINKGSTVVAETYLFQTINTGADIVLNLNQSMSKSSGGYTDMKFASANNCTINLGDGVNTGTWNIGTVLNGGWIFVNLASSADKLGKVSIEAFETNIADGTYNMQIGNFENYYIKVMDVSNLSINEDDRLVIVTDSYTDTLFIKAVDEATTMEYTDGWYLAELDGQYYLNNSNFVIPEPSTYAAILGTAAIAFAFCRRRK